MPLNPRKTLSEANGMLLVPIQDEDNGHLMFLIGMRMRPDVQSDPTGKLQKASCLIYPSPRLVISWEECRKIGDFLIEQMPALIDMLAEHVRLNMAEREME